MMYLLPLVNNELGNPHLLVANKAQYLWPLCIREEDPVQIREKLGIAPSVELADIRKMPITFTGYGNPYQVPHVFVRVDFEAPAMKSPTHPQSLCWLLNGVALEAIPLSAVADSIYHGRAICEAIRNYLGGRYHA